MKLYFDDPPETQPEPEPEEILVEQIEDLGV